jgi:hypothetical protein
MAATRLTPAPVISQIRDVVALNDDRFDNIPKIESDVFCHMKMKKTNQFFVVDLTIFFNLFIICSVT